MNFWKKIVKTIKDSKVTKGITLNNLMKKTTQFTDQITKLANKGGKRGGGKGLNNMDQLMSTAKGLTQKLKSGGAFLGNKLFKQVKTLGKHKSIPSKRQILTMVDKATNKIKQKARVYKIDRFHPKIIASKILNSAKQTAKKQANRAKQSTKDSFKNMSENIKQKSSKASESISKSWTNITGGSKIFFKGFLKFAFMGLFIYAIGSSIPRQIRKYFVTKQQLQYKNKQLNSQQFKQHKPKKQNHSNSPKLSNSFDYPTKQQVFRTKNNNNFQQAQQVYDYQKIRQQQIRQSQQYTR